MLYTGTPDEPDRSGLTMQTFLESQGYFYGQNRLSGEPEHDHVNPTYYFHGKYLGKNLAIISKFEKITGFQNSLDNMTTLHLIWIIWTSRMCPLQAIPW